MATSGDRNLAIDTREQPRTASRDNLDSAVCADSNQDPRSADATYSEPKTLAVEDSRSLSIDTPAASHGRLRRLLRSLNGNDLARDLVIGLILVLAGFATAFWLESRIAQQQQEIEERRSNQQEVLENTRFVREVVLNPDVKVQPFMGLNLAGAQLAYLDLSCRGKETWGRCADLTDADLSGANLHMANLTGAILTRSNLSNIDGSGMYLTGAQLEGANLTGANLHGADLYWAHLNGANLSDANLRGTKLSADLTGADLTGANLVNADLRGAVLRDTDLTGICYNNGTVWDSSHPHFKVTWQLKKIPTEPPRCSTEDLPSWSTDRETRER